MLSILVYTDNGKKNLPLDPGAEIEVLGQVALVSQSAASGTYSLPLDIDISEQVNTVLSIPGIEYGSFTLPEGYKVDVLENGIPVFNAAELHVMEINYSDNRYSLMIIGDISTFYWKIANTKLNTISIPIIEMGTKDPRTFATSVMRDTNRDQYVYQAIDKVAFAPIYWPDFIDTSRSDYNNEQTDNDIVNRIHLSGGTFTFNKADPSSPSLTVPSGASGYCEYKTVPFFYVRYIMECLSSSLGYKLSGDVLADPAYRSMHIFNNFSIDKAISQNNIDPTRFIIPYNHLPDISVKDFFSALQLLFGAQFSCDNSMMKFNFLEKALQEQTVDITDKVIDKGKLSIPLPTEKGIRIEYKWDSNDPLVKEKVLDINPDLIKAWIQTSQEINLLNYGTVKDGDLVYCVSENYYYQYNANVSKWLYYSEGLQPYTKGDESQKIEIPCSPLVQAKNIDGSYNNYSLNMVSTKQKGSYFSNSNTSVINTFELRFFFIKMHNISGTEVPVSYTNNRLPGGDKLSDFSLSLEGDYGLLETRLKTLSKIWYNNIAREVDIRHGAEISPFNLGNSTIILNSAKYVLKEIKTKLGASQSKLTLLKI